MDLTEFVGLLLILGIIIGAIYGLFIYQKKDTKEDKTQYVLKITSDSRKNNFLVLNEGNCISLTTNINDATIVTVDSDDVGSDLNKFSFKILKIKVDDKYVNITANASNVTNADDNIISFSDDFEINDSAEASLFLDSNNVLSAYFTSPYFYIANSTDIGNNKPNITFNLPSSNDHRLVVSLISLVSFVPPP